MGFLDNSGDIILDAVLTDLGRKRLAEGNGSFKIAKFALGDDEIDYGLYDKNNTSGSAYYDINILQTPVLEAFTNNMSSMNSRLMSIARNDLLYLPVIKPNKSGNHTVDATLSTYVVLADQTTVNTMQGPSGEAALAAGQLNGDVAAQGGNFIQLDQGLDTLELAANSVLAADLVETQYMIQIDNRLGSIANPTTNTNAGETLGFTPTSIDDDNIATYIFTLSDQSEVVKKLTTGNTFSVIDGPQGTSVKFKIAASLDLKTSAYLFNQLGTVATAAQTLQGAGGTDLLGPDSTPVTAYKFIDSTVRISGMTTGYTVDLPVRFVKQT